MSKYSKPAPDRNKTSGEKSGKLASKFPDFYKSIVRIKDRSKDESGFVVLPNLLFALLCIGLFYLILKIRQISTAVGVVLAILIVISWILAIASVCLLIRDCVYTHSKIKLRGQLIVSSIVHFLYIIVLVFCTIKFTSIERSSSTVATIAIYLLLCGSEFFCILTHLLREKDENNDCSWFAETTIKPVIGIVLVLLYTFVGNLIHEDIITAIFDAGFTYLAFTYIDGTYKRFISGKSDNNSSSTAT